MGHFKVWKVKIWSDDTRKAKNWAAQGQKSQDEAENGQSKQGQVRFKMAESPTS